MEIALVGAPNQGKSTLFNAITLAGAKTSPIPFTTIKPNEGVGFVKIKKLRNDESPIHGYTKGDYRFVPIKIIDVAGLVPGASKGRGLGNQFLNDISRADAVILVVDVSGETNEEGEPVKDYDFTKNAESIILELEEWFYDVIKRNWENVKKRSDAFEKLKEKLSGIGIKPEHIEKVKPLINDLSLFSRELRKISKPMLIAANKIDKGKDWEKLKKFGEVVPISALIEFLLKSADKGGYIDYIPGERNFKVLKELNKEQKEMLDYAKEFLKKRSTGVQECVNKVVFDILDQIVVYPVKNDKWTDSKGNVLPDAILMKNGSNVLDLAYKIHTDIGDKFIKAIDMKTGKTLSKNYILKNGDVIRIVHK